MAPIYTKNNFLQQEVGTPTGGCSYIEGGGGSELKKTVIIRVD
jgi:hypothetical protein